MCLYIIIPVFIALYFWNLSFWKKKKALKDSTVPAEFKVFFERIPTTHAYQPVEYGKLLPWGDFSFWKKVVAYPQGIEVRNLFFASLCTFVKHGEILQFRFTLPMDHETPLALSVKLKNDKTIEVLSTNMLGAAALIVELKINNPGAPWTIEERTTFGRREIKI